MNRSQTFVRVTPFYSSLSVAREPGAKRCDRVMRGIWYSSGLFWGGKRVLRSPRTAHMGGCSFLCFLPFFHLNFKCLDELSEIDFICELLKIAFAWSSAGRCRSVPRSVRFKLRCYTCEGLASIHGLEDVAVAGLPLFQPQKVASS